MLEFCQKSSTFVPEMNSIVRDSAKLLTANVVAQAIGLLVYPILTRLYSPDDFGLLNLFMSIGGVLVLLSTAEYQYAIVLPKDENKARSVFQVALLVLLGVTCLVALSIPFSRPIASLFKAADLARWWWLMPIYVAALGGWNVMNYYYIRQSRFTRISSYWVSQSVVNAGAKLSFGCLGWLNGGLILGATLGPVCTMAYHVLTDWRKRLRNWFVIDGSLNLEMARAYRNFPCFSLPKSLVNMVSTNLPTFMLVPVFGLERIGYWALAIMVSFQPINIIARSIYQVLYQKVAENVQQGMSIWRIIWNYTWKMGLATIAGLAFLYAFIPWLVTTLFGAQWASCASLIRYLYPVLALTVLSAVLCFLPDIFGRQRGAFILEVINLGLLVAALLLGIHLADFQRSIMLYSLAETLYILIQLGWFARLISRYEQSIALR